MAIVDDKVDAENIDNYIHTLKSLRFISLPLTSLTFSSSDIPTEPGNAKIVETFLLCCSFHASACSLPKKYFLRTFKKLFKEKCKYFYLHCRSTTNSFLSCFSENIFNFTMNYAGVGLLGLNYF